MDVLCWAARCCPAVGMRRCCWSPSSWSTWAAWGELAGVSLLLLHPNKWLSSARGWPGLGSWLCSGGFRAPWTVGFPLCTAREGEISPGLVCREGGKRDAPAHCGTLVMGANWWVGHPKYDRNRRCCGIYHGCNVNCNNRVERNPAPRGEGRESELEETPCLTRRHPVYLLMWSSAPLSFLHLFNAV